MGRDRSSGAAKPLQAIGEPAVRHLFDIAGGAPVLVAGAVAALFGMTELLLGQLLGAMSALGVAAFLAVVGGLLFLAAYPRRRDQRIRPFLKAIPLVIPEGIGWPSPRLQGKCGLPRERHLRAVGRSMPPRRADAGDLGRVRSHLAWVRDNSPRASVRHH